MKANNKITQLISFFLIIAILAPTVLFSRPKKIQASPLAGGPSWLVDLFTGSSAGSSGVTAGFTETQTAIAIKKVAYEVLKQLIMTVQKRLLAEMTKSMVNWINSGFHGSPLFLENPESFFRDIAKYEIKTLVGIFGYDSKRFPFGKDFSLNIINSYKRKLSDNAAYTLSNALTERQLKSYRNDFAFGGWNGFLVNTQYPQNNYIGFQMLATEELARKLNGTVENNVQKVQKTLDQGMGFLSPKTCADNGGNNEFNKKAGNQFKRPVFQSKLEYKPPYNSNEEIEAAPNPEFARMRQRDYDQVFWPAQQTLEKANWDKTNSCKNLVATTPGSVVASQITNAMGSTFRQSELGAALGSSMSAIFDALLNKFIGSGLNALATKINKRAPEQDTWSYDGQTLGSPSDDPNSTWDSGPDEEIILDKFRKQIEGRTLIVSGADTGTCTTTDITTGTKTEYTMDRDTCRASPFGVWVASADTVMKEEIGDTGNGTYIPGDIANTTVDLQLIYNEDTKTPGIMQLMGKIWPKSRELDMCVPGPDLGWKERTLTEMQRNSQKLQEKTSDQNGEKAAEAQLILKDLKFATDFFKDWIINNMMKELPSSVIYMDAVEEIETLAQQDDELTDKRRVKTQALARLEAIKTALRAITTQPEPGSANERILISLKKQYDANRVNISNALSVEETRNELLIAKEKLEKLNKLTTECNVERKAKGWSVPGGPTSTITNGGLSATEKNEFCDAPIKGGYPHGAFKSSVSTSGVVGRRTNSHTVTHPTIPLVNGQDLLRYTKKLIAVLTFGLGGQRTVNIQMSCNIIWQANVLDYKGNLPGTTTDIPPYVELPPDINTELGTCDIEIPSTTNSTGREEVRETDVSENDCVVNGGKWKYDPKANSVNGSIDLPRRNPGGTDATF